MNARTRRILTWTIAGVIALTLLVLAFLPEPVSVDTARVERARHVVSLEHEGRTRVRERFVVRAPVAGTLRRVELEPGDPVALGVTEVALIEPGEPLLLDARSRAEARAGVEAARAALDSSRAQVERAREEAELATKERTRAERLHDEGVLSREQLDIRRTAAITAREALSAAKAARRQAEQELEAAIARLSVRPESGGEEDVLTLLSPVEGVVLERFRESAGPVAAGERLLELGDPERLEIVADYLSRDAVRMRPGMRVIVERFGGEEALEGSVRLVEPSGFTKISALGVEEQRVFVVIEVEGAFEAGLRDDYRVETGVVVHESEDALVVPTGALFRDGEAWALFRVVEGRASLTRVRLGPRNRLQAQVLEGLEEGDVVVLHPPNDLEEGDELERRD